MRTKKPLKPDAVGGGLCETIEILEDEIHKVNDTSAYRSKLTPVHWAGFKRSVLRENNYQRLQKRRYCDNKTKAVVILNAVRKSDFSYVKNWPRLRFTCLKCRGGIISKSRVNRNQYLIVLPTLHNGKSRNVKDKRKDAGRFTCLLCDLSFEVLSDLEKHTVSHGQPRNIANVTTNVTSTHQQKIRHNLIRRIEAFECIICCKFYRSVNETEEHIICEHIEVHFKPIPTETEPKNINKPEKSIGAHQLSSAKYGISEAPGASDEDVIVCSEDDSKLEKSENIEAQSLSAESNESAYWLDIDRASPVVNCDSDVLQNSDGDIVLVEDDCEFVKDSTVCTESHNDVSDGENYDVIACNDDVCESEDFTNANVQPQNSYVTGCKGNVIESENLTDTSVQSQTEGTKEEDYDFKPRIYNVISEIKYSSNIESQLYTGICAIGQNVNAPANLDKAESLHAIATENSVEFSDNECALSDDTTICEVLDSKNGRFEDDETHFDVVNAPYDMRNRINDGEEYLSREIQNSNKCALKPVEDEKGLIVENESTHLEAINAPCDQSLKSRPADNEENRITELQCVLKPVEREKQFQIEHSEHKKENIHFEVLNAPCDRALQNNDNKEIGITEVQNSYKCALKLIEHEKEFIVEHAEQENIEQDSNIRRESFSSPGRDTNIQENSSHLNKSDRADNEIQNISDGKIQNISDSKIQNISDGKIDSGAAAAVTQRDKSSKKQRHLQCKFCTKLFFKRGSMFRHVKKLHKKPVCVTCEQDFESFDKLKDHTKAIKCDEQFICKICNMSFDSSGMRRSHIRKSHESDAVVTEKPLEGALFISHENEKNVKRSQKPATYKCRFCPREFINRGRVLRHTKDFHKKPVCITCQQEYANFDELQDHIKAKKCEELFKCRFCSKSFDTSSNMYNHLKRLECMPKLPLDDSDAAPATASVVNDSDKKPLEGTLSKCNENEGNIIRSHKRGTHKCKFCARLFINRSNMYRHVKELHKKSVCGTCEQGFDTFNKLQDHIKDDKCGEQFKCRFCDKSFETCNMRYYHVKKLHLLDKSDTAGVSSAPSLPEKPLEDPLSTCRANAKRSQKRGSYKCRFCARSFINRRGMFRHVKYFHKKPACVTCEQEFETFDKLQDHIKTKKCDEMFKCRFCNKSFDTYTMVEYHMKKMHLLDESDTPTVSSAPSLHEKQLEEALSICHRKKGNTKQSQKRPCKCRFCGSLFINRRGMFRHVKKFHKKPACVTCEQEFETFDKLQDHIKATKCDELFKCRFCDKSFDTNSVKEAHISKFHSSVNKKFKVDNYTCLVCKFSVNDLELMKQHFLQQHSNIALYCCSACGHNELTLQNIQLHFEKKCQKSGCETSIGLKWSKMWRCSVCDVDFGVEADLNAHWENSHISKQDIYSCPKCKMKFVSIKGLDHHMKEHESNNTFTCQICNFSCTRRQKMAPHRYQHCSRGPIYCSTCHRQCVSVQGFNYHTENSSRCSLSIPILQEGVPYRCMECNVEFTDNKDFAKHFNNIHLLQTILDICDICGKNFRSSLALTKHKLVSHSDKNNWLKCTLCPQSFPEERLLRRHEKLHEGENHTCEFCGKIFLTRGQLNQHIKRVHCKELVETKCEKCSKTFRSVESMKKHVYQAHGNRCFSCTECLVFYKTKHQLKYHMESVHSTERNYKCDICEKSLKTKQYLIQHRKHHFERKFECDVCKAKFKLNHHLKTHMLKHTGERAFKCKECEKSFSRKQILETHMLTHTGEKAFVCEHCEKSFFRKTDLNKHMRLVHNAD